MSAVESAIGVLPRELGELRLEEALRLLEQSGQPDPRTEGRTGLGLLQRVIDGLCELSLRDGLTGLPNRRHFMLAVERELDRVARTGEGAALLIIDVDHFKRVNDTHGHPAGDAVLRSVATALAHAVRPMDLAARLGGEEFAVILAEISPGSVRAAAERVRKKISGATTPLPGGDVVRVTASIGGALAPAGERATAEALIALADRYLYEAKKRGRDCVALAEVPSSAVTPEERATLLAKPGSRKP